MEGSKCTGQVAEERRELDIIAVAPSGSGMNESEFELSAPGESVVVDAEHGKRSQVRLVVILVALNVSGVGLKELDES